ncbi:hypothetical protein HDE_13914 [Halotydeus destructor]|nr:hypothetical protein HDE_13914 [Halotydeus destructor]
MALNSISLISLAIACLITCVACTPKEYYRAVMTKECTNTDSFTYCDPTIPKNVCCNEKCEIKMGELCAGSCNAAICLGPSCLSDLLDMKLKDGSQCPDCFLNPCHCTDGKCTVTWSAKHFIALAICLGLIGLLVFGIIKFLCLITDFSNGFKRSWLVSDAHFGDFSVEYQVWI